MFEISRYLERIDYRDPVMADLATLRGLHKAHMYAVPFENLSIHYGMPISLDSDALYKKIVCNRRGGLCYELNGLFAQLLAAIGFDLTLLSARVARTEGGYGPEFDHLTLLVRLEQAWLVDVGFGDSFLDPIAWQEFSEQKLGNDGFKLVPDRDRVILFRRRQAQGWKPAYSISPEPRKFQEFFDRCKFHASSPESPFSRHKMVRLDKVDGRLSLMDGKLSIISFSQEDRHEDVAEAEYAQMLADYFGIELDGHPDSGQRKDN